MTTSTTASPAPSGQPEQHTQHPGGDGQPAPADGSLTVRVRYFAGAAAAAGVDHEVVVLTGGRDVAALRERMVQLHPPLERVLAVATLLVDEVSAPGSVVLHDRVGVDVLPPFAGG